MQKIKLNKDFGKVVTAHGYELNSTEEYVIDINQEEEEQFGIMMAIQNMKLPALQDYHKWLSENGFNINMPNTTNDFVSKYYGVKPLWVTDLSQGIVVKSESDDDYYIVMECSRLNEGFKYTQVILTPAGCL